MNIPGYTIHRRLGAGGQAIVYLATQCSLQRQVALKVMHPHFAASSEFTSRFLNEGRILANLDHANVVTIHDIGVAGDLHYLAMERVEGGDLTQRIHAGLDPRTALGHLATIAECLAAAHARHIVHRDIKPGNVLFRRDGTLLLTDFGIAKQIGPDTDITISGIGLGSPHYLSPEQAQGFPLDGRADIYSLGAMAYEMLTRERPYRARSEIDTIFQHVHAPVPRLPAQFAHYQPLIDCTMAKAPQARIASAEELARYLRELRDAPAITGPLTRDAHTVSAFRLLARRMEAVSRDRTTDLHALLPVPRMQREAPVRRRPHGALVAALLASIALSLWSRDTTGPGRVEAQAPPPRPAAELASAPPPRPAAEPAPPRAADPDSRLRELLARAEQALADLRLTRPDGDNAVFYYEQARALDGGRSASLAGLDRVAARYAALATRALEQGDLDRAAAFIGRGLGVAPDDVDLRTLQAKLRRQQAMSLAEAPIEAPPRPREASPEPASAPPIQGESPAELLARIRGWFR